MKMTLSEGLKEISRVISGIDGQQEQQEEEVLTAEILHKLWLMKPEQLRAIYGNGRRKVRIANDESAYHKLWMMRPEQLEAIFGNSNPR